MRILGCSPIAWLAAIAALSAAGPVRGAELYLSGDLGISWVDGDGVGVNDVVGNATAGVSEDATPVYGGALGAQFPMNAALPWRMRLPGFGVPYWPGRELRFEGSDDVRFPDWTVRTEVEYLRGRDAELTTPSFTPLDAYRSDAESWTLMGKLRLDIPVRSPVRALFGYRAPFLEPVTVYGGAGAGTAETDLKVSTGLLAGTAQRQRFAWQALAGIGYQLNDRVQLSLGWRYLDFGESKTQLYDSAGVNRGRYSIDLDANEFTASLSVWFWRLPPLLGGE
jgi:opacity protein-like surface antigen